MPCDDFFLFMSPFFVDPTASVCDDLNISQDVFIGPYCVIGPGVSLGRGVKLLSHVVIEKNTILENDVRVSPFSILGGAPQDLSYKGEETFLRVGRCSVIREHVTLNRGTQSGGGVTRVGSHALIMTGAHVAHDCWVGDHVVLANHATLAGHVIVKDHVVLGGLSAVHQFSRIGQGAMIGGMAGVTKDVPPYTIVRGLPAVFRAINRVRLSRMGTSHKEVMALKRFYDTVRNEKEASGLSFSERLASIGPELLAFEKVKQAFDFLKENTKRSTCL